ncbi:hypothetical protein K227x_08200 [Rubripirellula lacrimiformis]|uniref:Uncharacterized protein n=1 Tax=Rubripirellula lacrimiformis TaxID=1930273 RepID=A0A517N5Q7_9BACT|nr:hypothetical protein [Rubripirellula lacrimiformis]QDT02443.1 hypothetical protein K227x_08200 [Rubripirellula lacrimiformis]
MKFTWILLFLFSGLSVSSVHHASAQDAAAPVVIPPPPPGAAPAAKPAADDDEAEAELPWDYSPYRVLVWVVADDPRINADTMETPLRKFLDRDFSSIWRVSIADAPTAVRAAASRDIGGMTYDMLTAADPVLAVKRDHADAVRIRIASNVAEFVSRISGTKGGIDELRRRGQESGDATVGGISNQLVPVEGDATSLVELWKDASTEAVLVSRGMAQTLDNPEAKLVTPPIDGLVSKTVEDYDKVFIVRVTMNDMQNDVDVVELDTLMRFFGPVASVPVAANESVGEAVGRGLVKAFAPVVRIDDAGQKTAAGLLRASGLIVQDDSPALIHEGDVLQPMTRKNDRNNNPIMIGPIDWAYLLVTEYEDRTAKMEFYAGRAGGLQGRKNNRTFRTALKARAFGDQTQLRLHAQGDTNFPLIGYEIYEKELKSKDMTFIGRTDWNGRLMVQQTDAPLRLMYVKNGGAVLARLPMVPGLDAKVVADLRGDDLRLQAEAYIRGVQNSIIDLVAVRELYKARIRMRLQNGQMDQAEDLMEALRNQPSNEKLSNDMGKKQAVFLSMLGPRSSNQKSMIDQMFITTRELLSKHINPVLVRELEGDLIKARKNGGKLAPEKSAGDEDEGEEASG